MPKEIPIRNSEKIKNQILRILFGNKSASVVKLHEQISYKPICGDVNAIKIILEQIKEDGLIELIPITEKGLSNSYLATINHRGIVFIKGSEGYSKPSFVVWVITRIKTNIYPFIFTVGTGLLIAFLAKILGWI